MLGILLALAIAGWLLFKRGSAAAHTMPRIRVAITIDDLPTSSVQPPGYSSERMLGELVDALTAHGVRDATGFVIGSRVHGDERSRAALARWADAGFAFGNHTYSHQSFAELGGGAGYLVDVARWEPVMRMLERASGQRARYFRYPYLHEGRTVDERKLLSRALGQLGYTLARVSMDFRDWEWADAYNRCLAQDDDAALAALRASYLESARTNFVWTLQATRQVFQRPLTHVLLLHANAATAQNMDALLTAYEELGVEFVPLSEALADPAYGALYGRHEGTLLELASERSLPPEPARPEALLAQACRGP